jgi:hypothetical protein
MLWESKAPGDVTVCGSGSLLILCKETQLRSRADLLRRPRSPLITQTDFGAQASQDVAGGMNAVLTDVFALY